VGVTYEAPRPGDVLAGKYRVESVLGIGGMGVVVLVEHLDLGQQMAIKLMLPAAAGEPQAVERFLREARAAACLKSEHVVRIYDTGTLDSGAPFMVMELLRGEDLGKHLARRGPLPVQEAVDFILQACHAISEAHAKGIVHRDLKPSNLFLIKRSDGSPLVKVLDFGISKAIRTDAGPAVATDTATNAVMGSPLYMSPEQVRNAKHVDVRADIWSLGVIMHELLTGRAVFQADTLPGICAAIIADDPPALRTVRPDAPPEIEAVLLKCLEKDVALRYQNTEELMAALRPFASASTSQPSTQVPPVVSATLREAGGSSPSARPPKVTDAVDSAPGVGDTQISARSGPLPGVQTTPGVVVVKSGRARTSSPPPAGRPGRSAAVRLAVFFAIALGLGIGIAIFAIRIQNAAAPQPPTNPAPAAAQRGPRKTFALTIESTPSGSEIVESDTVVGTTPIVLSVDNDLTRQAPRRLVVRREGFLPYSIVQGPSDENVHVFAALVESPATKPLPAPGKHAGKAATDANGVNAAPLAPSPFPAASIPAAPPPTDRPAPDIRLQR
jgi:eukaryotic-like serine/threonine-protein kinase